MSKAVAIIPARWGSTRFPGKMLHPIQGKPLIQHTWERCLQASSLSQVIIATDDMRIAEAAFAFGAEVALTSDQHPSGSDRIAEIAEKLSGVKHVINLQGDEPAIDSHLIDLLVKDLQSDSRLQMVTAATPFESAEDIANPNNVKVVTGVHGQALYFSRSPIPFDRDGTAYPKYWWHLGIYGYRRDFLLQYVKWKPTPLEESEKLEQLRALEHGATIKVITTTHRALGVDLPEDVERAEKAILAQTSKKAGKRKAG